MAYNNNYGGGGGYQQRPQGGYNQGNGGGGYQKTQYQAPAKKEFDLALECEKYATVYSTLKSVLEANEVSLKEVESYLGGWTTSLKINLDKS